MKYTIETRIAPEKIWNSWERAHGEIVEGKKGISHKIPFQIVNVRSRQEFTVLWKTLFVHLYFTHRVIPNEKGSEVTSSVRIKGFFAWPVRLLLGNKLQKNLEIVLKTMVRNLE